MPGAGPAVKAEPESKYLPELMAEKDSLDPSFTHAMQLLQAETLVFVIYLFFIAMHICISSCVMLPLELNGVEMAAFVSLAPSFPHSDSV
ncbi:KH domain-containing, RNA-binding, signal transduction-associated protein 1 [Varanus komodoensis]|nr:KH domain-containing, RNA-binding, signal transduction-associated protein 1 [Varanus komodoensis]